MLADPIREKRAAYLASVRIVEAARPTSDLPGETLDHGEFPGADAAEVQLRLRVPQLEPRRGRPHSHDAIETFGGIDIVDRNRCTTAHQVAFTPNVAALRFACVQLPEMCGSTPNSCW